MEAAKSGQSVIRMLRDDTDFVFVDWVNLADLQCKVQIERWDGSEPVINATFADLGQKCLQLLGMHALSGCDTTSYPYNKGKGISLNYMVSGNYQGIAGIGDVGTTLTELVNAAMLFFVALYSRPPETSMEPTRCNILTKQKRNPKVMALSPTYVNLLQHILQPHLQVML